MHRKDDITTNTQHYYGTLEDTHSTIMKKHPSMIIRAVMVQHDNAHPHAACTVLDMLHSLYHLHKAQSLRHLSPNTTMA